MEISMKLVYQYMAIFFSFSPTSNHLHPLQVENCDSNSQLVVDEDVKSGLKGLNNLALNENIGSEIPIQVEKEHCLFD